MHLFSNLPYFEPDSIFQVKDEFDRDPRGNKVDMSLGMYRSEDGSSYLFESVKQAQQQIFELPKDYLPITGDPDFLQVANALILPEAKSDMTSLQTAGGTGAFCLLANVLKKTGFTDILIPNPSWSNHRKIFQSLNYNIIEYPYFDIKQFQSEFVKSIDFIKDVKNKSILLLHGCCHNPSGIDFSLDQFKQLLDIAKNKDFFVIMDVAYQGLGKGFEQDGKAFQLFFEQLENIAICYSFSKNFGLYGERLGALIVKNNDKKLLSNLAYMQRVTISNPPLQGSSIVKTILKEPKLKKIWQKELTKIHERLQQLRLKLQQQLTEEIGDKHWIHDLKNQLGLFSFLPFKENQVHFLKEKYGLFFPSNGRINISSLNEQNFANCLEAFVSVLKK